MTRGDLLRIAATAALLALAWQIAGTAAVVDAVAGMQPAWLAVAVALTLPMQLLSAARWWLTCRRIGEPLRPGQALSGYYVASFLNATLPGGIAGDVARVWRQGAGADGAARRLRGPIHGVVLERAAGQGALALVLLAGLATHASHPVLVDLAAALRPALPFIVTAAAAAALLAAATSCRRRAAAAVGPPRPPAAAARVHAAAGALWRDTVRAFWPAPVLCVQALLSLAVVATYVAAFCAAAAAVNAPLDLATAALAVPLVLVAMALPVSVGGTGTRELAAAALWPAFSLGAGDGAATAVVYGLAVLTGSLPGALVLAARRRRAAAGAA